MKQRISTRPAFNEFSNKRKWSKTSAQVNERLLELSLVQGTFPDYNSTISCFSIDDPTFLCDLLARSTEGDSSVMSVNSLFYFSERSFKLKKSVHFPDELQLLLTETANSTHMHRVFMDGELVDSNKECGIFYGTLKGITASGSLHLRPLCSRSDLELAVFEMLEPSLFSSAVVYRPKSSDKLLVRDESTSFRFIYHLTSPHVWQTIRLKSEFKTSSARHLNKKASEALRLSLCPAMTPSAFDFKPVSVSKLDKHIVTTAVELLKFLMNERGDSLLSDFQVDFERVYEEVQQTNDDDKSPTVFFPRYKIMHILKLVYIPRPLATRRRFPVFSMDQILLSKLAKYHDQVLRKADNNIKTNSKLLTTEDDGYESPASRSSSDDSSLNLYDTEIASSGQTVGTTSSRSLSDIIEVKLNMNIFKKQMEAWGPGAFIRMCDKMSRMSKIVSEMRFLHVCRKYKIRLSDAELHSIFSHFDPKSTGFIDAKECLSEIQSVNVDIDALSLQNTVYDRDTDLFRARARLLGKDISPISSISTGSELKDPGLSFSVQNSINSACLSSTLDNNVNVVPDKKVEALQTFLNSKNAVKCFQQEFLNNPVCAPTVTFFDYLDSWRIQHLKQLATSDKPTVPSSSSADCIGLSNLSTYYLDTLYEYASKLSLYEVFMDKKDWIEDAHILSRALDTVESIGHNIARRNGMIVTDEDSRELLEVLLRLFDEQTAILIRARILSEYRRRNNIKDGQDRSGIIKATTVQESEARRVVIKPRRKLTSRKVVIPKAEHNSMTTNDESKAVPGMARFISPAQDSPGVEIARRPSDFRPRLYSRYRTSSFTLKTAPEVVKANAESWVHRLSAVPDETSEYANSALPSAALLRFDPAHDDEDAVLRHYARTWLRKSTKKSELKMNFVSIDDPKYAQTVPEAVIDSPFSETDSLGNIDDSKDFGEDHVRSVYVEEAVELMIEGGKLWGDADDAHASGRQRRLARITKRMLISSNKSDTPIISPSIIDISSPESLQRNENLANTDDGSGSMLIRTEAEKCYRSVLDELNILTGTPLHSLNPVNRQNDKDTPSMNTPNIDDGCEARYEVEMSVHKLLSPTVSNKCSFAHDESLSDAALCEKKSDVLCSRSFDDSCILSDDSQHIEVMCESSDNIQESSTDRMHSPQESISLESTRLSSLARNRSLLPSSEITDVSPIYRSSQSPPNSRAIADRLSSSILTVDHLASPMPQVWGDITRQSAVSEATAATDLSLPLLSPAAMSVVIVKQHTSQLPLRSSEVTTIEEDIPEKYARDMDLLVATGAKLAVPKHMKKQTLVAEQKITVTSVARIDRNTASSPRKSIFCDIGSSLYSPQPPSSTKGRSSLIRHSRVVGGTLMPVDDFDTSGVSTQLQQTDPEQSSIFGRNKYDDSARLLKKSSGSSTRKSIKKSLNDFKQLGEDNDLAHFKELALQLQFPSDIQSNLRSF